MPAKKQKVIHSTGNQPTTSKPPPQLPPELIDRIYSHFDPLYDATHRHALASSLRVSKAFHELAAPLLYRAVALHWLINSEYSWKATRSDRHPKLKGAKKHTTTLPSTYSKYIRYAFVADHSHKHMLGVSGGSARTVDILEVEMKKRKTGWRGASRDKWCNTVEHSGVTSDMRPLLKRCHALAEIQARTVIINYPSLYDEYSRSGPLNVPRFPESTLNDTERLII